MKHNPAWLEEKPLQQFFAATVAAGGEARCVGGCVRDFLLGVEGADVDIATTLTPEQNMEIAAREGWKAIPTGIDHGTLTLVLPGRVIEVTTLRRDVTTDGRRATVAYTDSWEEDAGRRDFTINALYLSADGKLTDFFDGARDIETQTVRFIGDATQRIEEDALRMLRFFRFLATHGKPPADGVALAAISKKKAMIDALSGERIANEMRKFLSAENPSYSLRRMVETGVAPHVFGRTIEVSRMIRLQLLEGQAGYQCSVWARALALLPEATVADADHLIHRWKLARHESKQLRFLIEQPRFCAAAPRHTHTRILRLYGAPAYLDWLLTEAATTTGIDIAPYVELAQEFVPPTFPITAADLMARGIEGAALGTALRALEQRWEESGYTLSKEALLGAMP